MLVWFIKQLSFYQRKMRKLSRNFCLTVNKGVLGLLENTQMDKGVVSTKLWIKGRETWRQRERECIP